MWRSGPTASEWGDLRGTLKEEKGRGSLLVPKKKGISHRSVKSFSKGNIHDAFEEASIHVSLSAGSSFG